MVIFRFLRANILSDLSKYDVILTDECRYVNSQFFQADDAMIDIFYWRNFQNFDSAWLVPFLVKWNGGKTSITFFIHSLHKHKILYHRLFPLKNFTATNFLRRTPNISCLCYKDKMSVNIRCLFVVAKKVFFSSYACSCNNQLTLLCPLIFHCRTWINYDRRLILLTFLNLLSLTYFLLYCLHLSLHLKFSIISIQYFLSSFSPAFQIVN